MKLISGSAKNNLRGMPTLKQNTTNAGNMEQKQKCWKPACWKEK